MPSSEKKMMSSQKSQLMYSDQKSARAARLDILGEGRNLLEKIEEDDEEKDVNES